MTKVSKPAISVIIINFNGRDWLKNCLRSLACQTMRQFEVVVVDDNSDDGSVEMIQKEYPGVQLIQNQSNQGFAKANNQAVKDTRGELILLLNNDTLVEPDFLEKLFASASSFPQAAVIQPKIVLMDRPHLLDCAGFFWTRAAFLYKFGYHEDATKPQFNRPQRIFATKGAAMLVKRSVIEKISLFDDDFWCYYEDIDFCHRVWLAGYECWYIPEATVSHKQGATAKKYQPVVLTYNNIKNKLASFLKNFSWSSLIFILPFSLVVYVCLSFVWLITGKWREAWAVYRAVWWNITELPITFKKRILVQSLRKKVDREYLPQVTRLPPLGEFLGLVKNII